jgi:S1-C subfamily serine protease
MKKYNKLFSIGLIPLLLLISLNLSYNRTLKDNVIANQQLITQLESTNLELVDSVKKLNLDLSAIIVRQETLSKELSDLNLNLTFESRLVAELKTKLETIIELETSLKTQIEELEKQIELKRIAALPPFFGGGGGVFVPPPAPTPPPSIDPRIAQLNSLLQTLNTLKTNYDQLVLTNAELTIQFNNLNGPYQDLILEEQQLDNQISALTETINTLTVKKDELNLKLISLDNGEDLNEFYIAYLEERIDEINLEIFTLEMQITNLTNTKDGLVAEKSSITESITALDTTNTNLSNSIGGLNTSIVNNQSTITNLESTLNSKIVTFNELNSSIEFYSSSANDTLSYNLVNQITTNAVKATARIEIINSEIGSVISVGSGVVFRKIRRTSGPPVRPIVSYDYYILTNYHVVSNEVLYPNIHRIEVKRHDGVNYAATLLASKIANNFDLALIRVTSSSDNIFEVLPLAVSDYQHQVDELVVSLGNPKLQVNTVTIGKLALPQTSISVAVNNTTYSFNAIQHSALINSGSSGGALLNANLEIIGINFAGQVNSQPFPFLSVSGFAIKLEYIYSFLNDYAVANPNFSLFD